MTIIPAPLSGCKVMICRPEPSCTELSRALEAVGADTLKMPMLEVKALEPQAAQRQIVMDLDRYRHIIVLSQHAAKIGMELIEHYWPMLPVAQNWYPIGRKTAQILAEHDVNCLTGSQDMTSEELLKCEALKNVHHDEVLIMKGRGGRSTLPDTLSKRCKRLDELELYERIACNYSPEQFKQHFSAFSPQFIVALSGETLERLLQLARASHIDLSQKSFILSSNRVANIAHQAGLNNVLVPNNLQAIDIIRCIKLAQPKLASQETNRNNRD